jgi:importin-9
MSGVVQEETWANDPNAFVAQEDDDTQAYSVRVAGFDLFAVWFTSRFLVLVLRQYLTQCLIDREPAQTAAAFQATAQEVVGTSRQGREEGTTHWLVP